MLGDSKLYIQEMHSVPPFHCVVSPSRVSSSIVKVSQWAPVPGCPTLSRNRRNYGPVDSPVIDSKQTRYVRNSHHCATRCCRLLQSDFPSHLNPGHSPPPP